MEKVAVAMSGGVDSSVAAALLKESGYPVIGVTMRVCPGDETDAPEFIGAACRVAEALGIPHHVIDLREEFQKKVISSFCREYGLGRTPNPCISCNRHIKFGALLRQAGALGARYIATGHHARVTEDEVSGRMLLRKGADRRKDQSYFLYRLTQEQLRHAIFPVGELTKAEVREIARQRGLPVSHRPESQDICFLPDNDRAGFLRDLIPQAAQPGPIRDEEGHTLGRHKGILNYTIGQRQKLGLAAGEPRYVTAIEPESNAIIIGPKESVLGNGLVASQVNWVAIGRPTEAITARARIRYRHPEAEAVITTMDKDTVYVKFMQPQLAITPGQAVVFYDGDKVLGGGTITSSGREAAPEHPRESVRHG